MLACRVTPVVPCGRVSFIFRLSNIPLYVGSTFSASTWAPMGTWAVVTQVCCDNTTANMGVQIPVRTLISLLWGEYPEVGWLNHVAVLVVMFKGTSVSCSVVTARCDAPAPEQGVPVTAVLADTELSFV